MNAHPELVGGRSPLATLTSLGKRQALALGVHLRSLGVDFDAVYSSPLERAKQTAFFVCQVQYWFISVSLVCYHASRPTAEFFDLSQIWMLEFLLGCNLQEYTCIEHRNVALHVRGIGVPNISQCFILDCNNFCISGFYWANLLCHVLLTTQELDIPKNVVEIAEALQELSQGQWEGQPRKEVYTARMLPLINATQPDFCAPGGESQRQVEFRMVEFLNNTVLHRAFAAMQEARLQHQRGSEDTLNVIPQSSIQVHPLEEAEMCRAKEWEISTKDDDVFEAVRENVDGVKLCKEEDETPDSTGSYGELRVRDDLASMSQALPYCAAVFTHGMAIKCLLRGLLGSDAHMTRRWCIDNSSISVLRHSTSQGWQIQRINDTSHLRRL